MVNRLYTSLAPTNPTRMRYQQIINNSRSRLLSERYGSYKDTAVKATDGSSGADGDTYAKEDTSGMSVEEKLDYQQRQLNDIWNMMRNMTGSGSIYNSLLGSGSSGGYSALLNGMGYGSNRFSWF